MSNDRNGSGTGYVVPGRRQGRYWIATIAKDDWSPCLPEGIAYLRGQLEQGSQTGYEHWQVLIICEKKESLRGLRRIGFPITGHYELSRSSAADAYVWKEETRIGEPFEYGTRPIKRSSVVDWDRVRSAAVRGELDEVPSDIFVRCYHNLQRIRADNAKPVAMVRSCTVFWGPTGVGKSRRAWELAGDAAYIKDPRSKFWCGYRGDKTVIIDEFRGGIDISHLLRWLDRYPVIVELKGSSAPLMANVFYITSNIHPDDWYPDCDLPTKEALKRRLAIVEMN